MMKKIPILVLMLFCCLSSGSEKANAQPQSTWRVGFQPRPWNFIQSIISTPDRGWIFVGNTDTNSSPNFHPYGWIAKLDSTGKTEWQSDFGQRALGFTDIIRVGDRYIVAGSEDSDYFSPYHGQTDAILLCIDTLGNIIWSHAYGGSAQDNFQHIIHASDGGLVMTGQTSSPDGDVLGYHPPPNAGLFSDLWVLKTDSVGKVISENTYGGSAEESSGEIRELPDGTLETYSNTDSFDGDLSGLTSGWKVLLLHLDSTGAKIAQSLVDLGDDVSAVGIITESNGNIGVGLLRYYNDQILGRTPSAQMRVVQPDGLVMSISDTDLLTNRTPLLFAGSPNGTAIFAGYLNTDSGIWVAEIDSLGHTMWLGTYFIQLSPETPPLTTLYPTAIAIASDNSFAIAGYGDGTVPRIAFVDKFASSISEKVNKFVANEHFNLFPNPCSNRITVRITNPTTASITLKLYDDAGISHGVWVVRAIPNVPLEVGLNVARQLAGSYRLQIIDGKDVNSESLQIQ